MPFNLCPVLHSLGMLLWLHNRSLDRAALVFEAAHLAGERIRAVLQNTGADDGETEELGWRARSAAYLIGAERSPERTVTGLHARIKTPGPLTGECLPPALEADLRRSLLVALVAADHLKLA